MFKKIGIGVLVVLVLTMGIVGIVGAQDGGPDDAGQPPAAAPFGGGPGRGGQRPGGDPEVLAEALGLTVEELQTALRDGQTVAEIAAEQGVALDDVIDAVLVPATEHLAQAVEDGKMTQEQADARLAEIAERIREFFENGLPEGGPGRGGPGRGGRGRGGPGRGSPGRGGDPEVLAKALGLTVEELQTALRNGQTVAEIAAEQGVSLDDVIDAVLAPMAERLREFFENGPMRGRPGADPDQAPPSPDA